MRADRTFFMLKKITVEAVNLPVWADSGYIRAGIFENVQIGGYFEVVFLPFRSVF